MKYQNLHSLMENVASKMGTISCAVAVMVLMVDAVGDSREAGVFCRGAELRWSGKYY